MHYVRRLRGEELYNCRDLGGYAVEGGMTKFGVFLRSEVPFFWTEKDVEMIREYGVTMSLDFRTEDECSERPSLLKDRDWVEYKAVKAFELRRALYQWGTENETLPFKWSRAYRSLMETGKPWMKQSMELAADCNGVCQFNCNSGKDRTGMFAAALLAIAGVAVEDIAADYCVSQGLLDIFYEKGVKAMFSRKDRGIKEMSPLLITSPDNIFDIFDYMDKTYGGFMGYLKDCGISDDTIEKIRAKFIERF